MPGLPKAEPRQWTRREARDLVNRLSSVRERTDELWRIPQRLRAEASDLAEELIRQEIADRLDTIPLDELRPRLKPGTRLRPLVERFETVGAILATPRHRMTAVNGVGERTVDHVMSAARQIGDELAADTGIRLDPVGRGERQTRLLARLAAVRAAEFAGERLGPQLEDLRHRGTDPLVRARRVTGPLGWLFAGRRTRAAGRAALDEIAELLADNATLVDRLDTALRAADMHSRNPEQLWKEFTADAASYYALLGTLAPVPENGRSAGQGHIDADLAERVARVDLDLSLVTASLRGYQHFGAQFVVERHTAILGDEMGLGKTVQALAVCAHLAARGAKHFLVVCPASVLLNWVNEIGGHTRLTAHPLHGAGRDEAGAVWRRDGGVAVTTFDTLAKLDVRSEPVDLVIVDEAHYIKNPRAARSVAVGRVLARASRAVLLSGTPMENRIEEFRTLVRYLRPALAERLGPDTGMAGATAFRRRVAEVYLRRNQSDVLKELPDRIEVADWVDFTAADRRAYRDVLGGPNPFGALERLRHAGFRARDSAKAARVVELVRDAAEDDLKVVVFSRYLDVLARVESDLSGAPLWRLTGSIPPTRRQEIIDEFGRREGSGVLLTQIEAGGTGVNLQGASVAIITEPQWKPGIEDQAIARLHRMGQVRTVQVHRILARETVDELLLAVQGRKRMLFDAFARESDAKDADHRAVDTTLLPGLSTDDSVPLDRRIVQAELDRLG